jgi:Fe-S oxidoreductase
MLALAGCVQPALAPNINAATARVLDKLGIALFEEGRAGCCGAVRFHLNDQAAGKADMRRNIDAWWPHVEAGVDAIVVTASGCGVQVRDYGHLLADDRPMPPRRFGSANCAATRPTFWLPRKWRCSPCLSPMRRNAASWLSIRRVRCSMA